MGLPPPGAKVPEIALDADGQWSVDGERILHERTCQVLTHNVQLLDDGRWVTSIGREMVPIVVADVALFVRAIDADVATLSDASHERVSALSQSADGRVYIAVKQGRAWARLDRGVHARLHVDEQHGRLGVWLGERFVEVHQR